MLWVCNDERTFKSRGNSLSAFLSHSNTLMYGVIYWRLLRLLSHEEETGSPTATHEQHRMCHPPPPYLSSSYILYPGITGSVSSLNTFSDKTEFYCENSILIHLYISLWFKRGSVKYSATHTHTYTHTHTHTNTHTHKQGVKTLATFMLNNCTVTQQWTYNELHKVFRCKITVTHTRVNLGPQYQHDCRLVDRASLPPKLKLSHHTNQHLQLLQETRAFTNILSQHYGNYNILVRLSLPPTLFHLLEAVKMDEQGYLFERKKSLEPWALSHLSC